jgi:hypothetical protein
LINAQITPPFYDGSRKPKKERPDRVKGRPRRKEKVMMEMAIRSRMAVLGLAALVAGLVLFVGVAAAQEPPAAAEGTTAKNTQDEVSAQARRFRNFTKTSIKPQSGFAGLTALNNPPPITAPGNPYSFSKVSKIARLNKVAITATIFDGSTGPGQFDENNLFLALDGINTGIALNGFRAGFTDTLTISGTPNNSRAIRNALKADKQLAATIIDTDSGDNFVSMPATFQTTLQIKGKIRR